MAAEMMNRPDYYVREFGSVLCSEDTGRTPGPDYLSNSLFLKKKDFESVWDFILCNQDKKDTDNPPFVLTRKGRKNRISVRNYVGVIETANGVSIEILPKIDLSGDIEKNSDRAVRKTRSIFLKMLRHLRDAPFRSMSEAALSTESHFPVLEVFVLSFIRECEKIVGNGLRLDYMESQDNLNFLRGKISVSDNIKYNLCKKHKLFCTYSEHDKNIPQNRIIKAALIKLNTLSRSQKNRRAIQGILHHLDDIEKSTDVYEDLRICKLNNRLFSRYDRILGWADIFLTGKSFSNFRGDSVNTAILFPMEIIFQDYFGFLAQKHIDAYSVTAQSKKYFLVDCHKDEGIFRLKPDFILHRNDNDQTEKRRIIIDTKWKPVDENKRSKNYNIKSSDMYQLYAYGQKCKEPGVKEHPLLVLVYPKHREFTKNLDIFKYDDNIRLLVCPFDCDANDNKKQITGIVQDVLSMSEDNIAL